MIKKKIIVRNLVADYPFSGDPNKKWYCEIVDSNLGVDGNPIVNSARQGFINLTCLPRHLNAELSVIFHTEDEASEVKKLEVASNLVSALPLWSMPILNKLAFFSKKLAAAFAILIMLSIVFATVNYIFDIGKFLDEYQKYNAANGARMINKTVKEVIERIDDPFYDSEGVKAIERERNISYGAMFSRVDEDLYLMKNVFVDGEGDAILMDYGDAEDKCDELGGHLLSLEDQQLILPQKKHIMVKQWLDQPEWSGTARGLFSDDYVINMKEGKPTEGMYFMNKLVYGDAEDVEVAARCGVLRSEFLEED